MHAYAYYTLLQIISTLLQTLGKGAAAKLTLKKAFEKAKSYETAMKSAHFNTWRSHRKCTQIKTFAMLCYKYGKSSHPLKNARSHTQVEGQQPTMEIDSGMCILLVSNYTHKLI